MNLGSGHRGDQFAAPSRQTSSAARGWYLAIPDQIIILINTCGWNDEIPMTKK